MPEDLTIRIRAQGAEQTEQALRRISDVAKQMGERLDNISRRLRNVAVVWGAALTGMGAMAIRAGFELERLNIQFRVLTGSTDAARQMMEKIREASKTSVFDFKVLAESAVKLGMSIKGVGGNIEQTLPLLQKIESLAVSFGQTTPAALEGIVSVFTQIINKGRVFTEELRQLEERGIPASALLAKALGLTAEQMSELGKQGISASQAINAILTQAEKMGLMSQKIEPAAAAFSTFKQTVWEAFARVGLAIANTVQGPLKDLTAKLEQIITDKSFQVFAQRVADAVASIVRGLTKIVEKIGEIIKWFGDLPPAAQKALAHLAVGGPLVTMALAGLTAIGSKVLWLARLFKIELAGSVAIAATRLGWIGAAAGAVAAGVGVLAGEIRRVFEMAKTAEAQRQREEAIKKMISQWTPKPGEFRVLSPEERAKRLEALTKALTSGMAPMLPLPAPSPTKPPSPIPMKEPKFEPANIEKAVRRQHDAEKKAREERERNVKLARQHLDIIRDQLTIAKYQLEQLIESGNLIEAQRFLQERIRQLLNARTEAEIRLLRAQGEQVTNARLSVLWLERQTEFKQMQQQIDEAIKQIEREAQQRNRENLQFIREQLEAENIILRYELESTQNLFVKAELLEHIAFNYKALADLTDSLIEKTRLLIEAEKALKEAQEARMQLIMQAPVPEAVPVVAPTPLPERPLELPAPMMVPVTPRFRIPAEPPEVAIIRAKAVEERAKAELELLRAQNASRQRLREAEAAMLQATLQRLQVEKEVLQVQLEQLKATLSQLQAKEALTEEDIKRIQQTRIDIAETEAALERIDAQIRATSAEIARNNPFEAFKRGIEDAVDRFEDAVADWLAGVGRIGNAFKNLWQDIKRQFWRVVVQEMFSPFFAWLREWARRVGEMMWGGIMRSPVLTMGLMPRGGGLPLPLPIPGLPPTTGLVLGIAAAAGALRPVSEAVEGIVKGVAHIGSEILKVFGIRIGGKKKSSPTIAPLGAAVYGPGINLSTSVTLQVDGRELGRVIVRQIV